MKTILFAAAVALAVYTAVQIFGAPITSTNTPVEDAWIHWKNSQNKVYSNTEHESYRFQTFSANYAYANEFNAQPDQTMKLGMTVFADLTNKEFIAQFIGKKMEAKSQKFRLAVPTIEVPDSVDWTSQAGHVNSVQNQGSCGSCWAFGTVAAFESEVARVTGVLPKFSEQRLVDCSTSYGNQGCNGGEFDSAYNYMKDHGNVNESDYKYTGRDGTCKVMDPLPGSNPTSFVQLQQSEVALKTAIARGPVAVGVDAASLTWQLYFGGVTQGWTCGTSIDHAVAAVGYGTSSLLGHDLPFWKIRNSWGSWWGEHGHIRMKRVAGSTDAGTCGVQSQAWQVNAE